MSNICPICRTEFTKAKCENCGFEMPAFAFLSEDDANEWYRKSLEDHKKKKRCESCGNTLQEEWKSCPYCGASVKSRENGTVFSSLQLVRTFVGHEGAVVSVEFSPDGRHIASMAHNDQTKKTRSGPTLKLWEAKGGWIVRTIENVRSIAFSPDSKYIVSASGNTLELWEAESGRPVLNRTEKDIMAYSVAFSPDGKYIVSGSSNRNLELYEAKSGWSDKPRLVRTILKSIGSIYSASFSPDGKYILSWSSDKTLELWEAKSGRLVRTFTGHKGYAYSIKFSPNGKYLVSGSDDGTLYQWETESGRLRIIEGHKNEVSSFTFSQDSKYIVSGSKFLTVDDTLKLWEAESGRFIHAFAEKDNVLSVAFSPDGRYIVSGSNNGTLKLWETESRRLVHTIMGHNSNANSVAFSPNGQYIVSGSDDSTLKLWELV